MTARPSLSTFVQPLEIFHSIVLVLLSKLDTPNGFSVDYMGDGYWQTVRVRVLCWDWCLASFSELLQKEKKSLSQRCCFFFSTITRLFPYNGMPF